MTVFTPSETESVLRLVDSCQPGYGLPRPFYHDQLLYRLDMETIWRGGWLFAGHTCQIPNPGDYFLYEIDTDSVIIARGDAGEINAFHNVCRHRGTLICTEAEGHVRRFVCPYHQWAYDRKGKLVTWRGMQEDLDKSQLGLHPVHLREVEGLIFISLAQDPLNFDPAYQTFAPLLRPQGFKRAKIAKIMDYDIHANWKLVWENNRECYHCNVNHPQYIKANFDHYNADDTIERIAQQLSLVTMRSEEMWSASGLAVSRTEAGMTEFPDPDQNIWYSSNRTPLVEGYVSETMDGRQVAPLMGDYTDANYVGTLRARSLPNFWNHSSCDHGVSTRLTPAGLHMTKVRLIWLVDEKAVEGQDYRLDDLVPFWWLTSDQDREICENAQRGVNSRAYVPGPLSTYKEYNVDRFLRWYLRQLKDHIADQ
jgi:Rieske 2Fe-2S family protein